MEPKTWLTSTAEEAGFGRSWYSLEQTLLRGLGALMAGSDRFEAIEQRSLPSENASWNGLSQPSEVADRRTLEQLFQLIHPGALLPMLQPWVSTELASKPSSTNQAVPCRELSDLHLDEQPVGRYRVSAWMVGQGVTVGPAKGDKMSQQKAAIHDLFAAFDLEKTLVMIHASVCRASYAQQILQQQGDYVLLLEKERATPRQKTRYEQVASEVARQKSALDSDVWQGLGNGRMEKRTVYVMPGVQFLDDLEGWPGLKSVILVEVQWQENGTDHHEAHYYLSSLSIGAAALTPLLSTLWVRENQLQGALPAWRVDIGFRQDPSRSLNDPRQECWGQLEKTACTLLHPTQDQQPQLSQI